MYGINILDSLFRYSQYWIGMAIVRRIYSTYICLHNHHHLATFVEDISQRMMSFR
jgi:hypothetical protein